MRGSAAWSHVIAMVVAVAWPLGMASPAPGAPVGPPAITHRPLQCLLVGQFPLVEAAITARSGLKSVRVYFKAHGFADWYYVDMQVHEEARYLGLLPQPLPNTKQVDYYIGALDAGLRSTQTREFAPTVTSGPCELPKSPLAALVGAAKIILGGTRAGQVPIPPGFSNAAISAFVDASGAVTTGAALTQSGSGTMVSGAGAGSSSGGTAAEGASAGGGTAGGSVAPTAGAGAAPAAGTVAAAGGAVAAGGAALTTALLIGGGAVAAAGAVVVARGGAASSSSSYNGPGSTRPNNAPTVTIRMTPDAAIVGFTQIAVVAAGQDPDGDALTYSWDFGDGGHATGATASHVYNMSGTFTVSVTASDPAGASNTAIGAVRAGSLSGLWHSVPLMGGTDYRCQQNGASISCLDQTPLSARPTAVGTLRQPLGIDMVYVGDPKPYYLDVACSGTFVTALDRFDCYPPGAQSNYGMTLVGP